MSHNIIDGADFVDIVLQCCGLGGLSSGGGGRCFA